MQCGVNSWADPRPLRVEPRPPRKRAIAIFDFVFRFLPQRLVEGLLNFRRRECRSFWLDFAFQDPPENGPMLLSFFFFTGIFASQRGIS